MYILQALASIECDTVMVVVSGAVSLTVSTHFKPAAAATATATATATAGVNVSSSIDGSADTSHSVVSLETGARHKLAVIKAGEVFPAHVSAVSLPFYLCSSTALFDCSQLTSAATKGLYANKYCNRAVIPSFIVSA